MLRNSCVCPFRFGGILFLVATLVLSPWLAGAQQAGGAKAAVPPANSGKDLVAVLDLEGVGATKIEASAMTDRLREELLKTGRFTIVDRSQMQAVLDEQALQQSGCTTQECAVQVGKVLGVRKIISGKVTKITDTQWLLTAQLVDVETSETQRAESMRHRGDYFSMLDEAIVQLAAKLATSAGAKPDLVAQLSAQQQAQQARAASQAPAPPPPAAAEQKKSSSVWWWIIGGVLIAGAAVAAGSSSSKKSSSTPSAPSSCTTNCSTVSYSW